MLSELPRTKLLPYFVSFTPQSSCMYYFIVKIQAKWNKLVFLFSLQNSFKQSENNQYVLLKVF